MIEDLKSLVQSAGLEHVWLFLTEQPYYILNRVYAERRITTADCKVLLADRASILAAETEEALFEAATIVKDNEVITKPKRKKK